MPPISIEFLSGADIVLCGGMELPPTLDKEMLKEVCKAIKLNPLPWEFCVRLSLTFFGFSFILKRKKIILQNKILGE